MRSGLQTAVLLAILAGALLLTACSTGSLNSAPAPVFTNTPGTAATQGSTYTYQIQSEPSTGVTYTLGQAPSGAVLAADTITWTPTAAQSRVPNQFSVTAATSGGSTTLFWSITPAGTVNGSQIDTYWTPNGPVPKPFDWTKTTAAPAALVPQPDGSLQTLQGSGNSDGTFTIPDVPGGYYWLSSGGLIGSIYWTSTSTIDLGQEFDSGLFPSALGTTTTVQVNYSGLDPLTAGDELSFLWGPLSSGSVVPSSSGATTLSLQPITTSYEFTQPSPAFLLQYEPENSGSLNTLSLGPAEITPSFPLQNGTANTINGTLAPSPEKSLDLNVQGSAWAALLDGAGPGSFSAGEAYWALTLLPFVTNNTAPSGSLGSFMLPLLYEAPIVSPFKPEAPLTAGVSVCAPSGQDPAFLVPGGPPITTDEDFGTATYGDPFPSDWQRVFIFCQGGFVSIPFPGASVFPFSLFNTQSTALPTSQVKPLIGHVQNPTLNGSSLFQANTIAATGATLSWTAPNGTPPTGYAIHSYLAQESSNGLGGSLARSRTYYTRKTSAVLPPLQSGKTYILVISAILDGGADFETQPSRSALPTASVSVVSGAITVQ
jgi:hypothetical protein